jgi:ATP-dependent DNA helicase RecG
MVPTSILAEQHYRSIGATLAKMPGDRKPVIALLTGALSSSERQSIYRGISDGSIDVVMARTRLIQEGVEFKD